MQEVVNNNQITHKLINKRVVWRLQKFNKCFYLWDKNIKVLRWETEAVQVLRVPTAYSPVVQAQGWTHSKLQMLRKKQEKKKKKTST